MMAPLFFFALFALFHPVHLSTPEEEREFYEKSCPSFRCLGGGETMFPYRNATAPDFCGPFVVEGCDEDVQIIQLEKGGRRYEVKSISQGNTISVTDNDLKWKLENRSCQSFDSLGFPNLTYAAFHITSNNLTMLKCEQSTNNRLDELDYLSNYTECEGFNIYYANRGKTLPSPPPNCSIIHLPGKEVYEKRSYGDLFGLLTADFTLDVGFLPACYWCSFDGGTCSPTRNGQLKCIGGKSSKKGNGILGWKLGVGGLGLGFFAAITILLLFYQHKRKHNLVSANTSSDTCTKESICLKERGGKHDVEEFLKSYGTLAPKRFSYSEIKKITKSFREKLGKGAYGEVFKGKLPDGSLVAVKVLTKSKTNGEDFINEVASIGRTSHVNIVTLLGFCFEGSKRALIYEFMSGGSLEKYIYEESYSNDDRQLGWETLLDIAIGIARGLEYLHRGCNTRILHFDIKPHNILLDENFCPKVSDFGLAKICPQRESIISMVGARGTAGYIAPEVFCRNFGGVSHKSDVYSYGMMVFEMVGGRKNIRVEVENSSEIYFPHWIHKRLELGEDLGLCGTRNVEERQIAKKMILVSLWCIQTNPSDRPAMGRVVEMLQGSLESIPIPPKPYLSSPSGSPQISMSSSRLHLS